MADSYRNDQYYDLSSMGERTSGEYDRSGWNITSQSFTRGEINKKFIYPDRNVREIAKYNPGAEVRLKRGYIRSLNDMVSPNASSVKCQFQFNPKDIQHSVAQSQQIRNFLLLSPEDMAQPIPGATQFSFDLFFDRTMEYNNSSPNDALDTEFAWEASDPSQVGVLHDIGILYSVIGVGMSRATKDFAKDIYSQQLARQNQQATAAAERAASQAEDEEDVDDITLDVEADNALTLQNLDLLLDVNVGNAAFLLPFPIRAVFSSLYIVEGFVTEARTVFTKFSKSMVPLQCAVNLQIDAKYVGFAREKTFLAQSLQQTYEEEVARQYEPRIELAAVGDHDFGKVVFALADWKEQDDNPELRDNDNPAPEGGLGITALRNLDEDSYKYLHCFVKDIPLVTAQSEDGETSQFVGGKVNRLFIDGSSVTVSVDGSLDVWAYSPDAYDTFEELIASTTTSRSDALASYLRDRSGTSSLIGGLYTDSGTGDQYSHIYRVFSIPSFANGNQGSYNVATTKEEWEKIYKEHRAVSWGSKPSSDVTGTVGDALTKKQFLHSDYWWAYQFTGKITITKDGSTTVTSEVTETWSQQYDGGWGPGTSRAPAPSTPYKDIYVTTSFDFASGVPAPPEQPWGPEYGSNEDLDEVNNPYSDFGG
jgi:hypothetical protein